MAVFRIEKTRDYTVMSNHHLRNAGLSLKSKGLLSMMLSLPEDWNYTTRGLAKICKEGTDSIGSALKELERAGYIVRNRLRDSKGKIVDVEYVIYETPHPPDTGQPCEDEPDTACPDTGNPDMDNPCLENRPQLNKEKRNPEEQNTDSPSTEGSNPIQSSPQTPAGGKRTGRDWMRERESYRELILKNIEYDYLCRDDRLDRNMLNELVELMVDTVCSRRETICIAGDDYPAEVVKSRFLKLNSSHIEYVLDRMRENTTYAYLDVMDDWLRGHGMPPITRVYKTTRDGKRLTLEDECLQSCSLPSIAYGFKRCSLKHKIGPQEKFCNHYPTCQKAWAAGKRVVKFIGYDAGEGYRSDKVLLGDLADRKYSKWYPLMEWGWTRDDCIRQIEAAGLPQPGKSSCFFCPSMKPDEITALREQHPDLFRRALALEDNIAASYPFDDPVGLVLNDEGKLIGLDLNRSLRDEHGEIYDIVAGTFLVVGLGPESFASLPPDMIQKYTEQFKRPELFASINGQIVSVPVEPENPLRTAEMTLEDDYGMIDGIINNGRRGEELEKAQAEACRTTPEKKPSIRERLEDAKRECAERKGPDKPAPQKKPPELCNL